MFSRLFAGSKSSAQPSETKRIEESLAQLHVNQQGGRAPSPTVTESASIAASAPPGSPSRGGGMQVETMRTPSPVPQGMEMDVEGLRNLVKGCPVKTVYDYVVSQLDVASPSELSALSTFFAALTPPAQLHCVRCHKWFYEVENDDRSCTMAHDDESAEVEHVGYGSKRGGAYETRWDCCGRTVEGSGDLGPPSGWCYEGKHTVDRKRARYRNDSTTANDLLQSCEGRGCHRKRAARQSRSARVVIADDARSVRSTRSVETSAGADKAKASPKKRGRKRKSQVEVHDEDEDADDGKSVVTEAVSVSGSVPPESKRKKRKISS